MAENRLILLVDDNEDDRILLRRAFRKAGVINPVQEINSGWEAIQYMEGSGQYSDRSAYPYPGILLLDLNMPHVSGFQVLQWIRDKMVSAPFLVIVLSRLDEIRNINRAYALGANSFLTKPGEEGELQALIKSFHDYWIVRNKAPSSSSGAEDSTATPA
jgi:CheY-like chemotaxis protein